MIYVNIFLLMLLSWGLSFFTEQIPKGVLRLITFLMVVAMVVIAATKPDTSSDWDNYYLMFVGYDEPKYELTTEPTYLWFSKVILQNGGSFRMIFWIYALLSIPLKMYVCKKMTSYDVFLTGLPVYLAFFFTLHDCEQVRISAALSFIVLGYWLRSEGWLWSCILLVLMAVSLHYSSALLIVPMLLTPTGHFGRTMQALLLGCAAFGMAIWASGLDLIAAIPIPALQAKLALYELSMAKGDHPEQNAISPIVLVRIGIFLYMLFFYDTIRERFRIVNVLLCCQALAIFSWFAFRSMSVFAVRVSEMFEVFDFLLWGALPLTIRPVWVGRSLAFLVALFFLTLNIVYNQFRFL